MVLDLDLVSFRFYMDIMSNINHEHICTTGAEHWI